MELTAEACSLYRITKLIWKHAQSSVVLAQVLVIIKKAFEAVLRPFDPI